MKRRDFIQKTLVSLGLVSAGIQIIPEVKAKAAPEITHVPPNVWLVSWDTKDLFNKIDA